MPDSDDETPRYNLRRRTKIRKEPPKPTVSKKTVKEVRQLRKKVKKEKKPIIDYVEIETESDDSDFNSIDIENTDHETETTEEEDEDEWDDFIDSKDDLLGSKDDIFYTHNLATLLANAINNQVAMETEETDDDSSDEEEVTKFVPKKKKQEQKYQQIKERVRENRPTIQKLMSLNIPFKEQCELYEQIKILNTMGRYSPDYLEYKKAINQKIQHYVRSSMKNEEYKKYDGMEKELLKDKSITIPLKYRILSSNLSEYNKKIVYEKYLTLEGMEPHENNYTKLSEWIDWAISVPSEIKDIKINNKNLDRNLFLTNLRQKLDKQLYGMNPAKEEIMCIVNDYITNNNRKGNGMGLVGSPGIGKTTIVKVLADCLDIPFQQISLGGVKDASYIHGHSYTYEGAKPGAIVECLRRMKYKNGIIFFDEFDKLGDTEKGMEVANALLHITDSTQNHEYKDMYLSELKIDLSNIWFIYSMNNEKLINPVLRDRIPIIQLDDYKEKDKVEIFTNYLFPNALKQYNYTDKDITISRNTVLHLIGKIRKEKGVRELKRTIESIIKKIHLLKSCTLRDNTMGELNISFDLNKKDINVKQRIDITTDVIDKFLPKAEDPKYLSMFL